MMPFGGGQGGNWGQPTQWNPQDGSKQSSYNNQVMGGNMNNHPNMGGGSQPNPQGYQQNWNFSEQQQNQWQQQWQQQYPNGWVQNGSWQANNQQWQQNPNQWQQQPMFQAPNNSWGSTPALPVQNPQPPPPPPPPANAQQAPPPPPPEEPSSLPPTDAERDFDLQFKEWEAKYAVWREENKNHPDKKALAEYETQWNTWREHLLANREQMRKQRAESLNLASQTISAPATAPIPVQKPGPPTGNISEPNLKPPIGPQLPRNATITNQPVAYTQPEPLQRKVIEQQATVPPSYQGGNDNHGQLYSRNHEPLRLNDHPGSFHEDPYRPDDRRGNYFPDRNQEAFYDDLGYPEDYHARPYHPSEMEYNRDPGFPGPPRGPLRDREVEHPRMRPHPDMMYREEQLGPPRPLMGPLEPPERFSPVPEGETAASMFRKRALRGKTGGPSRFSAPLAAKVVQEPESRPRIEERLAVHAEIKLPPGVIPPEVKPSAVGVGPVKELEPAIVKDYSNALPLKPAVPEIFEPVVIEYHHQPQPGRHIQHSGPVFKDYSHGSKRPRMEPTVHADGDIVPLIPKRELPTKIVSPERGPNKTVSTFTQLFPSAAAIQEKERTIPQTFPKAEDLVVPDPPRIESVPIEMETVMVEDLLLPPGRYGRPAKLVVILRGLPGSGKSHIARLIKEKEVLMGGSAPRILSIDDYYSMDDGSPVAWQSDQEEQYRQNLLKSLKRNLDDGHFPFVIVDALHARSNEVVEVASTARGRAFSVFLVDLPERMSTGTTTRKCSDSDIEGIKKSWQEAPREIPRLDIGWLLQDTVSSARISTPEDIVTSTTALFDDDSQGDSKSNPGVSKWETMEQTEEKLDRLDGIVKKKLEKPASMEDWLQSGLPDDYDYNFDQKPMDGKKRVRWADVEEKMQQKKMRDVGFVVGQTDWRRMTDPTFGDSALTKTKYI